MSGLTAVSHARDISQSTAAVPHQSTRHASLYGCFTIPAPLGEPRTYQVSRSRTAQRRRRLARGVARWLQEQDLRHVRVYRVAQLTLTMADPDPAAARRLATDFWRRVHNTFGETRYFCWLEVQRRGAVHYHAIWINPPKQWHSDLVRWVSGAWDGGRTQVRFAGKPPGSRLNMEYVTGYVKKHGPKDYQQQYEDLPSSLRTFMSQRLRIPAVLLDAHRDAPIVRYVAAGVYCGEEQPAHLLILGERRHVLRSTECSALRELHSARGAPAAGRRRRPGRGRR